jgi:hypothetical protein
MLPQPKARPSTAPEQVYCAPMPHCPGPAPPQVCPAAQVPHEPITLPQPSPAGPHSIPWAAQVTAVHDEMAVVGAQVAPARFQIMYSKTLSLGVIAAVSHSAGTSSPGWASTCC